VNNPELQKDHKGMLNEITFNVALKLNEAIDEATKDKPIQFVDLITITSNLMNTIVLGHLEMVSHAQDGNDALILATRKAWTEKLYLLMADVKEFGE